ncbi:MAG: hypothetical protein ACFFB3_08415 [Candidatus Hodarchaeota archaeon]
MDATEGPKIEYSWTSTRESKSLFSRSGLIQLFTISAMSPSNTPRMIQFNGSLCLISLSNDSPEEKTLLTILLNNDETPEAQFHLWKKLRTIHGRLKTVEKLVPALEKLVSKQNSN